MLGVTQQQGGLGQVRERDRWGHRRYLAPTQTNVAVSPGKETGVTWSFPCLAMVILQGTLGLWELPSAPTPSPCHLGWSLMLGVTQQQGRLGQVTGRGAVEAQALPGPPHSNQLWRQGHRRGRQQAEACYLAPPGHGGVPHGTLFRLPVQSIATRR